ncbi:MAG: DinB family protein [Gemmatimonadota bacterium]
MSIYTNAANSTPEEITAYVAALLDLLREQPPLTVLAQTESVLRKVMAGITPKQLTAPEAPGKWSVRHVLQHLADSELVWGFRLRMILAHDRPPITGYDQDAFASRLGYDDADAGQALSDFTALRCANLRLLQRTSTEDLQRVGVHSERGEESLAHLMKLYAAHDLLHLRQIDRILHSVTG